MFPRKPTGTSLFSRTNTAAKNPSHTTIELFLDFCCPYSLKIWNTINHHVIPSLISNDATTNIDFIFHQLPQPWHPQSTLLHESALVVRKMFDDSGGSYEKYLQYSDILFTRQEEFFDINTWDKKRKST